jgi:hypothetical protein
MIVVLGTVLISIILLVHENQLTIHRACILGLERRIKALEEQIGVSK